MTTTLTTEFSHPLSAAGMTTARRSRPGKPERLVHSSPWNRRATMAALTRSSDRTGGPAGESFLRFSAPGAIGGAVLQAARRSAGLTRRRLARMLTVSSRTPRRWENGTCPLFCVRYDELCRLATALDQAGATAGCDAAELVLASRCDLLVTGMLQGSEDYAEVPPIDEDSDEGEAARSLLRWALTGDVPERYQPCPPTGPLLTTQDRVAFTSIARHLIAGSHGDQLAHYGAALAALARR